MPPSRLSDRVQVCRPERSAGERAQFRGDGRDGPPFRGTPIPRKGPARGSRFGVQEPPASNSSPSCILRSPSLGVGRGEVGSRGSTACRLQSAPRGLPVAPGRPLSPGFQRSGHGRLETWQPGRPGTEGRPARAPRTVRTGGRPRGMALDAQARAQPAAAAGAVAAMSARPRCRSPAVMSSAEPPPRRPTPAPRGPPRPRPAPRAPGFGDAEAGGGRGTMRRAQVAPLPAALPLPVRRVSGGAAPGGCARVGAGAPGEGGVGYPRPSPCQVAVC